MSELELANIREAYADADVRNAAGSVIADIDVLLTALEHAERALAAETLRANGYLNTIHALRAKHEDGWCRVCNAVMGPLDPKAPWHHHEPLERT